MGEYTDRVLGLIPSVREERRKREAEEAAAEAERRRKDAELERMRRQDLERATSLGREVVDLLTRRRVAKLPVYERSNDGKGPFVRVGGGWHIATINTFMGSDAPAGTAHLGIRDSGTAVEIWRLAWSDPSKQEPTVKGIVLPFAIAPNRAAGFIENPTFQRGVASLVDSGKPYSDRDTYDYQVPYA